MNHTCLYSPAAKHHRPLAGTHCAYPRRNGEAELTWVAGYIGYFDRFLLAPGVELRAGQGDRPSSLYRTSWFFQSTTSQSGIIHTSILYYAMSQVITTRHYIHRHQTPPQYRNAASRHTAPLRPNVTSFIKPEVHNVSPRRQMSKPRPQGICTNNFVKISPAVLEICSRIDRHTDRQTDCNTLLPYWGEVTSSVTEVRSASARLFADM